MKSNYIKGIVLIAAISFSPQYLSSQVNPDGSPFAVRRETWPVCANGTQIKRCDYGQGSCEAWQQKDCSGPSQ